MNCGKHSAVWMHYTNFIFIIYIDVNFSGLRLGWCGATIC